MESKGTISEANVTANPISRNRVPFPTCRSMQKGVTYETKPRSGRSIPVEKLPPRVILNCPDLQPRKMVPQRSIWTPRSPYIQFRHAELTGVRSPMRRSRIIVTIRKVSSTGSRVDYTGSINSAKNRDDPHPSELWMRARGTT